MGKTAANKVIQVWESRNKIQAPNNKEKLVDIIDHLAMPFSAGLFYYVIFNMDEGYKVDFVSDSVYNVLGYTAKEFTLNKIFETMHPEDLHKMEEKEIISLDFKLNKIKQEDIPLYKTVYTMRFKHSNGKYRTILHQSKAINISQEGKIQQTLSVHTDVTHLNIPIDHKVSFISSERPSFFSIETKGENKFIENSYKDNFTRREIEIIEKLAEGKNVVELAKQLHLSPHTVNTHKKNILRKIDCKNTTELIAKCIREGVI